LDEKLVQLVYKYTDTQKILLREVRLFLREVTFSLTGYPITLPQKMKKTAGQKSSY